MAPPPQRKVLLQTLSDSSIPITTSSTPTRPTSPIPTATAPPNSDNLSETTKVSLGLGLGLGIPTLLISYLGYRVARREEISKGQAIENGLLDLVTLGSSYRSRQEGSGAPSR